jgi:histidyl-tRNA synthetase
MSRLSGVKGFHDVLPPQSERFSRIERRLCAVLRAYNYVEIRTPIAERTELFARTLGETTDIVEKEMYTFEDRDGTLLTLRPECTASVVRAAIEGGLAARDRVAKLYYLGPMFRRERPQKGRSRQFHQVGVELLGREDALADAEVVSLLIDCLAAAGVRDAELVLNSLGDAACRPAYRSALEQFGRAHAEALCETCRRRLERNPLRLLDCKEASCRALVAEAPRLRDHLCDPCRVHFDEVEALLTAAGVRYRVDPTLVRGLDYYVRTAFEVLAPGLGAQNAVGGGGRYDGLVGALGGPPLGGIGFAIGLERLVMSAGDEDAAVGPEMCVIPLSAAAAQPAFLLARALRGAGASCELEVAGRSAKSAMRRADKLGARFALLIGDEELAAGRATVRDLRQQADHRLAVGLDGVDGATAAAVRALGGGEHRGG